MPSHAQVAKQVRMSKEKHPERFCPHYRCLWRTEGGSYCPRHQPAANHYPRSEP